jgi:hypothetical protein|tara:strand:+ start:643 stop:744 length:102 start_codon:yes stop_codon:yes gene_type:complete
LEKKAQKKAKLEEETTEAVGETLAGFLAGKNSP